MDAANRDSALELMRRAREAKQAGNLQRAVQLMQRACAMYADPAQEAELREVRMAYARQRDERNNATDPPRPRRAYVQIPMPLSMRRVLGRYVGNSRVDAVAAMCGLIIVLSLTRFLSGGKAIWTMLGRLPGDINMSSGNMSVHFPLVSSMLVSLLLSWAMKAFMGYNQAPSATSSSNGYSTSSSNGYRAQTEAPLPGSYMNSFSWLPGVQAQAAYQRGNVQMHGGVYFCSIQ